MFVRKFKDKTHPKHLPHRASNGDQNMHDELVSPLHVAGLAFQGHLVIFDIEKRRIGWSMRDDCDIDKIRQ